MLSLLKNTFLFCQTANRPPKLFHTFLVPFPFHVSGCCFRPKHQSILKCRKIYTWSLPLPRGEKPVKQTFSSTFTERSSLFISQLHCTVPYLPGMFLKCLGWRDLSGSLLVLMVFLSFRADEIHSFESVYGQTFKLRGEPSCFPTPVLKIEISLRLLKLGLATTNKNRICSII